MEPSKACPFCGGGDLRVTHIVSHSVSCTRCGAGGPAASDHDSAVRYWDNRSLPTSTPPRATVGDMVSVPRPALAPFDPWTPPVAGVEYVVALMDGTPSKGEFTDHGRLKGINAMGEVGMHGLWFRGVHSPYPVPMRHVRAWRRVES